ncbi:MAG: hypothetical protein AAGI67_03435 [Pseudomonadota bacterium]
MPRLMIGVVVGLLAGLAAVTPTRAQSVDSITDSPWREAVVSVTDLDRSAAFFTQIGGYEAVHRGNVERSELDAWGLPPSAAGESLLLTHAGNDSGMVRLVRFENAGPRVPMRPGARTWDSGCYFSLMIRMKDIDRVYQDAIGLGWWTETPITDLTFGKSKLRVVIYRGPDGVQVQGYERLEPPLPEAIGPFDRLTRPFNMMQMVRDRDAAYQFFTEVLGFDTFYNGKPYVAPEPQATPLGIPINLTTSVRYRAGIVYPKAGEFGRMEMIEVMDLDGNDYADRCLAPNLGILAVRFEVNDAERAAAAITERGWPLFGEPAPVAIAPYGLLDLFTVRTPDGALVQFFSPR